MANPTPNMNPDTGIRYGVIRADSVLPDVLEAIERQGVNVSELEATDAIRNQLASENVPAVAVEAELAARLQEWSECDQEQVYLYTETDTAGNPTLQVQTAWLGGAQLLYVLLSPHVCAASPCSPCCPGAGDLDNRLNCTPWEGGVACYDVPAEWRDCAPDATAELDVSEVSEDDPEADAGPEPYVCEVVLEGFNGGTDASDQRILWVVTAMPPIEVAAWMHARDLPFFKICTTDVHTGDDAVDFNLPEEEHDFAAAVRRLGKAPAA